MRPKALIAICKRVPAKPFAKCGNVPSPCAKARADVGEGLVSASAELRASFGKAAGRLSSEPPHSTSIRPADDHSATLR